MGLPRLPGHNCKKLTLLTLVLLYISQVASVCEEAGTITTCNSIEDVLQNGSGSWINLVVEKKGRDRFTPSSSNLNSTVFEKVRNIEEISIFKQAIDVEAFTFKGLSQLNKLILHENKLTVLKTASFGGITYLELLDLSNNEVENLAHDTFKDSLITSINFSNNKLTNLQVGQLNLASLERLNLSGNQLQYFATGCFHYNLEALNLDNNNLRTIPVDALSPLGNLKELTLSRNNLSRIVPTWGLKNLVRLDLSRNNLERLPPYSFSENSNLMYLYLGHNKIKKFQDNFFPSRSNLKVFHFQKNLITGLDPRMGTSFINLEEIAIGGNPWPCPCLNHVQKYMKKYNVTQNKCETEYFKSGRYPVCIVYNINTCEGNQELSSSLVDSFYNSIKNFDC